MMLRTIGKIVGIGVLCCSGAVLFNDAVCRVIDYDRRKKYEKWEQGYEAGLRYARKNTWFNAVLATLKTGVTVDELRETFENEYEKLTYF